MSKTDDADSVRETAEEWEQIPHGAKVVGIRRPCPPESKSGYAVQQLANDLRSGRISWPKGVFRFKSHAEADEWLRTNITSR